MISKETEKRRTSAWLSVKTSAIESHEPAETLLLELIVARIRKPLIASCCRFYGRNSCERFKVFQESAFETALIA